MNRKTIKFLSLLLNLILTTILFSSPLSAQATSGPSVPSWVLEQIAPLLQNFINYLFGIAALVALLFLIWGGFGYIVSGDDPKKLTTAKNQIKWAIIGAIITLFSFLIINFVADILRTGNLFAPTIPSFP